MNFLSKLFDVGLKVLIHSYFFLYYSRKRLNAESCLKHPWISSISAQGVDRDLSSNKNNIKNAPKNNKYYLFDSASKTMSVASNDLVNEDDEW